jgi:serine/threonine protein kinase
VFNLAGQTFGEYQVLDLLGHGSMFELYKAYQPKRDCYVALIVLGEYGTSDPAIRERFRHQSESWITLQHPNIPTPLDYGEIGGTPFRAEEYIQSIGLDYVLKETAHSPALRTAVSITLQLADALQYAHSRGVVHQDVKPGNILITQDHRALLRDFYGMTALTGGTVNPVWVPSLNVWMQTFQASGTLMGTPAYLAPEQLAGGAVDHRCDLYSLGIVFYEMAAGNRPFHDTVAAMMAKSVSSPRQFNPALPDGVERVLLKALSTHPDDRYQTAGEMIEAIQKHIVPALGANTTGLDEATLRQILTQRFSFEELRTLCADLRVSFDDLSGEGQEAKARELIAFLQRRERLGELASYIRRHRPDIKLA